MTLPLPTFPVYLAPGLSPAAILRAVAAAERAYIEAGRRAHVEAAHVMAGASMPSAVARVRRAA